MILGKSKFRSINAFNGVLLPGSDLDATQIMTVVLSMIMAMACEPIWTMVNLSNSELFPTPIR